jgi:uncharacterized protein (TIGR02145 family)
MIFLTQIVNWKSKRPEQYDNIAWNNYYFLNTNRIVDLITFDGTGSQFKYCQFPDDHRCSPDTIETNTSVVDIEAYHNVVLPIKFAPLPIFPTNDMSRVLIDTPVITYIDFDDICMAYCTPRDIALNVAHVVYYRESFKRVTCIINMSFAQIQSALGSLTPLLDYDSNIYSTVRIGTQEWIIGNLRTTHYADGTAIPNLTDTTLWHNDVTGAYCWYDNDPGYKDTYGALYSWYAATNIHGLAVGQFTQGGIVSPGWRIPTMADWAALGAAVGGTIIAGGHLKEMGIAHWDAPNNGATDTYGFRMMGNGNRWVDDQDPLTNSFDSMGEYSDTWSQDTNFFDPLDGDSVYVSNMGVSLSAFDNEKYGGMAVRAVRDV